MLITMTLSWTPSEPAPENSETVGYIVYFGTATGRYTASLAVGNVTTYQFPKELMTPGELTFFAVAAYDSYGERSYLSNEVTAVRPLLVPPKLIIGRGGDGVTLRWDSVLGLNYVIWFKDKPEDEWTSSSIIAGDGKPVYWSEVVNTPERLYRVEVFE